MRSKCKSLISVIFKKMIKLSQYILMSHADFFINDIFNRFVVSITNYRRLIAVVSSYLICKTDLFSWYLAVLGQNKNKKSSMAFNFMSHYLQFMITRNANSTKKEKHFHSTANISKIKITNCKPHKFVVAVLFILHITAFLSTATNLSTISVQ